MGTWPSGLLVPLFLLTFVVVSPRVFAQSGSRFIHWTYQDIGGAFRGAKPRDALIAGGAALLVAGGSEVDPDILDWVQDRWDGTGSVLQIANDMGDTKAVIPIAGLFGVSLVTNNTRFQDAAFTSLQAWIYGSVVTNAIKYATGRARPDAGLGANSFDPFSGDQSLPSGHAMHAFAMMTPWVYYYPSPITYGLLGAMSLTAVARVALNKHWPTDVVLGAGIGFLTGRFLSRQHQRSSEEQKLSIVPEIGFGHYGLRVAVRLD